jgi:hypothetical protein
MEPPILHVSEADAVRDMAGILRHVGARGAVATDAEVNQVNAYLSRNFAFCRRPIRNFLAVAF